MNLCITERYTDRSRWKPNRIGASCIFAKQTGPKTGISAENVKENTPSTQRRVGEKKHSILFALGRARTAFD